jgi:hypothetical protein
MIVPVISAGIALALSFAISAQGAKFGPAVAARFLERGNTIPLSNDPISAEALARWSNDPANRAHARGYVRSVLPMDVVFLVSLGTFLATGSDALAHGLELPQWIFWIVPASYMAADLVEDGLIAWTLSGQDVGATFGAMRIATKLKLVLALASFLQFALCAVYVLRELV